MKQTAILDQYGTPINKVVDSRALLGIDLPGSYFDSWHKQKRPNRDQLISEYKGIAYCCSNLNANRVSQTGISVYRKSKITTEKRRLDWQTKAVNRQQYNYLTNVCKVRVSDQERIEELVDHPLIKLLDRPNPFTDWVTFSYLTELFKWIVGGAYWYIANNRIGQPAELYLLYPQWLKTHYNEETQTPEYYEYGKGNETKRYELDEVISFILPNPRNQFEPFSPLFSVFEQVNMESMFAATEAAILQNEGKPSAILTPKEDGGVDPEDAERWEQRLNSKIRRAGAGGIIVLEGDADLKPLQFPPKDLALLKIHDNARLAVCNAYGVPFVLFNNSAGSQYDVQATVIQQWIDQAIVPQVRLNTSVLNRKLVSLFDDTGDLILMYDDPSPENRTLNLDETTKLVTTGIMTPNEARLRYGLEPCVWGETPAGMYSQDMETAEPEPAEPETEQPATDQPEQVETDGGTPEQPAPVVSPETQGASELLGKVGGITGAISILQALSAGTITRDTAVSMFVLFYSISPEEADALVGQSGKEEKPKPQPPKPEEDDNQGEPEQAPQDQAEDDGKKCCGGHSHKSHKGHDKTLPKGERLTALLRSYFAEQRKDILGNLTKSFEGAKEKGIKAQLPAHFTLLEHWNRELYKKSQPLIELQVKESFEEHKRELIAQSGISDEVFNVTNPRLQHTVEKLTLHFCDETNKTTSRELNKTLSDLRGSLSEGLTEGDRMTQLKERVEEIFDSAEQFRAERIAQTEASRAHHEAQREVAKQSGVVEGFQLLPSSGACDLCMQIVEEVGTIGLDDSFHTDPDAPADYQERFVPIHPSCECAVLSVLSEDKEGE